MESRPKSSVLQPLFDSDHLNIPLIVLKHRVPHLFSSRRNPRRSKRTSNMSVRSHSDRSADEGKSRGLTAAHARAIVDDVARVRTEIPDGNLSTSSPDQSSSTAPTNKPTDLCLTLLLAEQLSASATIEPGTEEWATKWKTVLAKIKEIYAKVLPPLRPDFEGSVDDECRTFDTDIEKWIRAQVPVYVSYLRRFPKVNDQAVQLVESLQNAFNTLQSRTGSDVDQTEQVCDLVATILEAMQLDTPLAEDSMSIDTAGQDIFGLAQAQNLLESDASAFMEDWSSLSDDDSITDTLPSDVLHAVFAGASQAAQIDDDQGFSSEESMDVGLARTRNGML
ncbi:hypothetical protein C8Q79DRAFT_215697 [Trametes meyenii]|nr:hypothetical protein C8Q79DRAFT_215697 [Trametes meyenii]